MIQSLSDDELYQELQALGITIGPVVATTRGLYERKLADAIGQGLPDGPQVPSIEREEEFTEARSAPQLTDFPPIPAKFQSPNLGYDAAEMNLELQKEIDLLRSQRQQERKFDYDLNENSRTEYRNVFPAARPRLRAGVDRATADYHRPDYRAPGIQARPMTAFESLKSTASISVRKMLNTVILILLIAGVLYIWRTSTGSSGSLIDKLERDAEEILGENQ